MAPTEAVSDRCYIAVIKEEMEKNNESRSLKIVSPGHTTDDGIFICIDQGRVRSFYGRKIRWVEDSQFDSLKTKLLVKNQSKLTWQGNKTVEKKQPVRKLLYMEQNIAVHGTRLSDCSVSK